MSTEIKQSKAGSQSNDAMAARMLQRGMQADNQAMAQDAVAVRSRARTDAFVEEAGSEIGIEDEVSYVVAEGSPTDELDGSAGLFGGALAGAAAGFGPLAAGAAGLAALAGLAGSDDDEAAGGGNNGGGGGGGGDESVTTTNGLAGGLFAVGDGINQTPAAPLTQVTDAVASGLLMVGDGLQGVAGQDPTGVANLLANLVGTTVEGSGANQGGLVGLVSELSEGLATGSAGTPLEPLISPLATLLGNDGGVVDGVAQGLANVGSTLGGDASPLAPLTADVLAPIVGGAPGQDSGLPGTLNQASEGLTDLTATDSALAPLAPLTDALSTGVTALSDGVMQAGQAITDFSANDPSGLSALVGDLLGGTSSASSMSSGAALPGLPGLDVLGNLLPV